MRPALFAALVLLAAGCDSAAADRLGAEVTLRDLDGEVVTTGTLSFDEPVEAGASVTGTYRLGASPDPSIPASGSLQASCDVAERDDLSIALSIGPDSGVELYGTCADGLRGGEWVRYSIAGPRRAGTFELR